MNTPDQVSDVEGFDWDEGNVNKNRLKHDVEKNECEEVFINKPQIIFDDEPVYFPDQKHSVDEERMRVHGATLKGRLLAMIFTVRQQRIRVISVRDQNKKERVRYKAYINSLKDNHEKTKKT